MKKVALFFALFSIVSVSCLKDERNETDAEKISVKQYVASLKSNKYDSSEIPIFEISDIPELLEYARDEQIITRYPMNPVLSYRPNGISVGFMVLWTIEGIRLDVDYPSAFPVAADYITQKRIPLNEAADLYEIWWETNKNKGVDELKEISPFEGTGYQWL